MLELTSISAQVSVAQLLASFPSGSDAAAAAAAALCKQAIAVWRCKRAVHTRGESNAQFGNIVCGFVNRICIPIVCDFDEGL